MSEADEFVNHIRQFFHSSEIDELEEDLHKAYDEIETLRAENEALRERVVELEAFLEHCEYQKDIMGSLSFNTINQYKKRIKELESKLGLDST